MVTETARQVRVMGHVQGVAYRAWTRAEAEHLGLRGWVRNNVDGSVSALLVGPDDAVETMIGRMWDGPGAASVRDVRVETPDSLPSVSGFDILR